MAEAPTYRLTALLDLRSKKKEEAERYLGDCITALQREQEQLEQLEKEMARMVETREKRQREYSEKVMQGEMSAQGAIQANKYLERLKELEALKQEEIDGQKTVVERRQSEVEGARADLVIANRDLKALEKHKEKWQEKVRRERLRKEESVSDDVGQTIYRSRFPYEDGV